MDSSLSLLLEPVSWGELVDCVAVALADDEPVIDVSTSSGINHKRRSVQIFPTSSAIDDPRYTYSHYYHSASPPTNPTQVTI